MDAGVAGALALAITPNPTAAELTELGTETATGAADAIGIGSAGITTGAELASAAPGIVGSATATAINTSDAAVVRFAASDAAGATCLGLTDLGAIATAGTTARGARVRGAATARVRRDDRRAPDSTSGMVRR